MKYLAILIYDTFFIGGAIYLYGWKGWSGWWIVLGIALAGRSVTFSSTKD